MRAYLAGVTAVCFLFSSFSGACIHTLIEVNAAHEAAVVYAATLVAMPVRDLSEVRI